MRALTKVLAFAVVLISSTSAFAAAPRTVVGSVGTTGVPNANTVRGAMWGPNASISVTCYYAQSPLSTAPNDICAGGGDFDSSTSKSCFDNGATVLQDFSGYCFYRKNFGLNGVVDARQCGVVGDGKPAGVTLPGGEIHPDDGAVLNSCMTLAATLSSSGGTLQNTLHIVTTGGGVVFADNSDDGDIVVPENTIFTCGGSNMGTAKGNDYRIFDGGGNPVLTNGLVLAPGHSVTFGGNNATYRGCNEEAGPGTPAGGVYPNPYSPAIWYPDCKPDSTSVPCETDSTPMPYLRSAIDEYNAFNPHPTAKYHDATCVSPAVPTHCGPASNGVAIRLTTYEHLSVEDVTALGFGTCYSSGLDSEMKAGKQLVIGRLHGDCDTGISVDQSPNATDFSGFVIAPFLTRANGNGSVQILHVAAIGNDGSGHYRVTVAGLACGQFQFEDSDTVWIATAVKQGTGAESAAGRWTVANPSACGVPSGGQMFTLAGSVDANDDPLSLSGNVQNTVATGLPANAISGISTDPNSADNQALQLVAIGQKVTGPCIPNSPETTVTDVWPAQGIVYLSAPAICPGSGTYHFQDNPFSDTAPDCSSSPAPGCMVINSTTRMGDGIVITNSGGTTANNCGVSEHLVAFHFSTNANSSRFNNCATNENIALPDQDIIALRIDGDHVSSGLDACGNMFSNSILGQHRTVGILIQSNCATPNHLSNVRFSGNAGGRRNGVALEVDAGTVGIANSDDFGLDNLFKADKTQLYDAGGHAAGEPAAASLSIGNNQLPQINLFMADNEAAASTSGCGNKFAAPTPYLCAPSSFTQLPGGRLTLTQSQPVMQSDVTGAGTVYYVPYASQQVPIYSPTAGVFGLADILPSGLTYNLHSDIHLANTLYDLFVETQTPDGTPELCSGPAWSSSGAGSSARASSGAISQVNGVWVNLQAMNCAINGSLNRDCPPQSCTYVGTIRTGATAGTVSQQFNPAPAIGGGAPCLCVYNAYNRVTLTSKSLDSSGSYSYASGTWRLLNSNTKNSITVVDGLGQMQISAQLLDALLQNGKNPAVGIDLDPPAVAPPPQPLAFVQSNSAAQGSYTATFTAPPVVGLWVAQGVESAIGGTGANAMFGGSGLQQLSVQVAD